MPRYEERSHYCVLAPLTVAVPARWPRTPEETKEFIRDMNRLEEEKKRDEDAARERLQVATARRFAELAAETARLSKPSSAVHAAGQKPSRLTPVKALELYNAAATKAR